MRQGHFQPYIHMVGLSHRASETLRSVPFYKELSKVKENLEDHVRDEKHDPPPFPCHETKEKRQERLVI